MALETRSPTILRFGTFEVDLRAGELRKQGVKIKVREQPFQVLAALLQQPEEDHGQYGSYLSYRRQLEQPTGRGGESRTRSQEAGRRGNKDARQARRIASHNSEVRRTARTSYYNFAGGFEGLHAGVQHSRHKG